MKIYWCGVDGSSHRSPCIVPSTQDMCIHIHSHVEYTPFHAKVYRLSSSRRAEYKPYVNRVFVVSNYLFTCVCVCVQRRWQRLMCPTPLLFDLMPFSRSPAVSHSMNSHRHGNLCCNVMEPKWDSRFTRQKAWRARSDAVGWEQVGKFWASRFAHLSSQ